MTPSPYLPTLPQGYDEQTRLMLAPGNRNRIVATHNKLPPLFLDEDSMQWRELDRHIGDIA